MEVFKTLRRNRNYKVSNMGRIYSVRKDKILTNKLNRDGYLRIQLYDKGSCEFVSIHRLVAEEFIGDIPDGYVINHKDLNKSNNCANNLEIVNQKDNINHAISEGVFKLDNTSKACAISDGLNEVEYSSATELSIELNLSFSYVSRLCRENRTWNGLKFRYL